MTQSRKQAMKTAIHHDGDRATYRSRPHDIHNLYVSLKQWRIFHAVVDCGGFAEAAKSLHLSQSTISYTVAKLQDQLGTALLRIEGRRAILTPEGRALLERSRNVLKEAVELETFAKNLGQGWGEDVRLVVDHNFPVHLLTRALSRFTGIGKGAAHVRVREVPTLQAEDILRDPNVDLAISERVPLGYLGEPLTEIEYIAVAHPRHPLLRLGREVTSIDLQQHIRIDMGHLHAVDKFAQTGSQQARRWMMNSFDTVIAAVREGLGYSWLPAHRVQKWLDEGELVRLPLGEKRSYKSVLYLIHGRPWCVSPAASRLAEVLRGFAGKELRSGEDESPAPAALSS
ncbi:MAG TPA: LysR family transcriptional regulator [Noviherbaspirillum sp.]|uniref:LysR family transcriptional regulator n=1 Tax=Noviherbaspirillum sp. TaxID=1926288 RepID=UPI002D730CC9|nr:LysR family transcriptional regulator [Noviherbaspirillum sp.]HYD95114.1 LysR family transcriptional regulator [Noviherbaspirillum sp.]